MLSFPQLLLGDPSPFAWKYSVGNVLGLASSGFLSGFQAQLEAMWSPVRLGATAAYLSSIAATVICALVLHNALLTLLAMCIQFAAVLWYCASFIPFGRNILHLFFAKWCCRTRRKRTCPAFGHVAPTAALSLARSSHRGACRSQSRCGTVRVPSKYSLDCYRVN